MIKKLFETNKKLSIMKKTCWVGSFNFTNI